MAGSRSRSRPRIRSGFMRFVESTDSALFVSDDGGQTWEQARQEPVDGLASVLFREPDRRSEKSRPRFQDRRRADLERGRGQKFCHGRRFQRGAWRRPRGLDRSDQSANGHLRRRRRDLVCLRRRQANGGKANNLPISQFYHVSVDDADPYQVYGGLQDNSCWVGQIGVSRRHHQSRSGKTCSMATDSIRSPIQPIPIISMPNTRAVMSAGSIATPTKRVIFSPSRTTRKSCAGTGIRRWSLSPNEKGTLYIGAQFLFRSRDHGQSWERISPDLTTNDPEKQKQEQSGGITVDNSAAEMHTTIFSISESPKDKNVIWVGTDDGNLQLTRDGAKTWNNVVGNVPGLPEELLGELGAGEQLRCRHRLRRLRSPHFWRFRAPMFSARLIMGRHGRRS